MGEAKQKREAEAKHLEDCGDFVDVIEELSLAVMQREIYGWTAAQDREHIELLKRQMKDFLRRNSAAKGIYVEGDHKH